MITFMVICFWQSNSVEIEAFNLNKGSTWTIQDGYYDNGGTFHYIAFYSTLTGISVWMQYRNQFFTDLQNSF